MSSPSIFTLKDDVRKLFDDSTHMPEKKYVEEFLKGVEEGVYKSLSSSPKTNTLRGSNIGLPDRKLWLDINRPRVHPDPNVAKIFLTGDILESFFIFLFREAGHDVTRLQEEVELEGIKGHIDCVIDGVLVDVKTASWKNYQKFVKGDIYSNDPYGYIAQLSMYAKALDIQQVGWIPINKVNYDFEFVPLHPPDMVDPVKRIRHVQNDVLTLDKVDTLPLCYEPKIQKNGNKTLPDNCTFCNHKYECWKNLRAFSYSWGTQYLVEVKKEPRVSEIFE